MYILNGFVIFCKTFCVGVLTNQTFSKFRVYLEVKYFCKLSKDFLSKYKIEYGHWCV